MVNAELRSPAVSASGRNWRRSWIQRHEVVKRLSAEHRTFGTGLELPGYRVLGEIGRGSMGVVFRAMDSALEREVAIKVMAEAALGDHRSLSRFMREARTLAKVSHRNVLPIYHVGTHEGRSFIVMQLVRGCTLRDLLGRRSMLAPGHALMLMAQVGDALDAVHRSDVTHRDVKPENILLEGPEGGEHARLADFGLARPIGDRMTESSQNVGTLWYMAPEQLRGEPDVGPQADLYAFALVFYEVLTGKRLDVTRRNDLPVNLPKDSLFTEQLRAVFSRALAPVAMDRYESAGAFVADARAALAQAEVTVEGGISRADRLRNGDSGGDSGSLDLDSTSLPRPDDGVAEQPTAVERPTRRRSQNIWAAASATGLALMLGIGGFLLLKQHGGSSAGGPAAPTTAVPSAASPSHSTTTSSPSMHGRRTSRPAVPPVSPSSTQPSATGRPTSKPPTGPTSPRPGGSSVRYEVCGDTVTVRAAPETKDETTTVATLHWGETFVVEYVKNSAWARGYSPEDSAARGWVLRSWIRPRC
ncbi:protein kinase [Actinomadura graeca]|uniref:non-specific serine/threonine protein kinase n=1 Tax=Actinomadura graeca TaxID=2750812 RepID=A0ABX8QXJ4_9ACTN|nr:serine/threonine-protein kinase [Actinomadura graeca]QXJ22447.1 protein kinase [Actinomadura graeca]